MIIHIMSCTNPFIQKINDPKQLLEFLDIIYKPKRMTFGKDSIWLYDLRPKYDTKVYPSDIFLRLIELKYKLKKGDFNKFIKFNIGMAKYGYLMDLTIYADTWIWGNQSLVGYKKIINYFFDKYKLTNTQSVKIISNNMKNNKYWLEICLKKNLIDYLDEKVFIKLVFSSDEIIISHIINYKLPITIKMLRNIAESEYFNFHPEICDKLVALLDHKFTLDDFNKLIVIDDGFVSLDCICELAKNVDSINFETIYKIRNFCYGCNLGKGKLDIDKYWDLFIQKELINDDLIEQITCEDMWRNREKKDEDSGEYFTHEYYSYIHESDFYMLPIMENINIFQYIINNNYPISKRVLDTLLKWNLVIKQNNKENILSLYEKNNIDPDYHTVISLIMSYPTLSDFTKTVENYKIKLDIECLKKAVQYASKDIVQYIMSYNILINYDVYKCFLKRDLILWSKEYCEYISDIENDNQDILDLILTSNLEFGLKEYVELIDIECGVEHLDCFNIKFDEEFYFEVIYRLGEDVDKYEKYWEIDSSKLKLREMFRNKKLSQIKQFIAEENVKPDRYCFEYVCEDQNKKNIRDEIIQYLLSINCKPTNSCLRDLGHSSISKIFWDVLHKIHDPIVDYKYMCEECE